MTTNRKLRVFLCHSSQDKPTVRELYGRLCAEEWIDPWLDEEKILPGQDWDYEIEKALSGSDAVIVTLTKGSVSKEGYIQRELRFVLDIALEKPEGTIFILPVRLEDCEPPRRLRSFQYADYFPAERRDIAFQRLRASLKLRANGLDININTPVPPSPAKDPMEPVEYFVEMRQPGIRKIDVIKVIRTLTNHGLDEAKRIAETYGARVISTPDRATALDAKSRLESAGAVVEITNSTASARSGGPGLQVPEFVVKIRTHGASKINVIKVIRELTNMGLGEAKTLSETPGAKVISTSERGVAMDAKRRLEKAGAIVDIVIE